jgi:predicted RNA-binding Zn-ribbon protein involved in translation (DUF1610 family)
LDASGSEVRQASYHPKFNCTVVLGKGASLPPQFCFGKWVNGNLILPVTSIFLLKILCKTIQSCEFSSVKSSQHSFSFVCPNCSEELEIRLVRLKHLEIYCSRALTNVVTDISQQ